MKIGILSDTHNHKQNTLAALDIFRAEGVARLFHCGDITGGDIVMLFQGWDITFVYGNMDQAKPELAAAARRIGQSAPQRMVSLTLDGYAIALTHGHDGLQALINRQEYRYVLHGHTHVRRDEWIGRTRVINPGALGGSKIGPRSVAVLDVASDTLRFIDL